MRTVFLPVLLLLALGLVVVLVTEPFSSRGGRLDAGRPRIDASQPGVRSKPRPTFGGIEARIVDRPGVGEARVEATWRLQDGAREAVLEVVLPQGAWLLEGDSPAALPAAPATGSLSWLVGHEEGRALDLVLRLRARGRRGPSVLETYVRLADDP